MFGKIELLQASSMVGDGLRLFSGAFQGSTSAHARFKGREVMGGWN